MNLYMILSSFVSGILGSMGFGGGTVLIIYLINYAAYSQKVAQGINLIFFVPCALVSILSYRKSHMINFRQTLPVTLWATVGAIAGFVILGYIPTQVLSKIFGGFLSVLGILQLFGKERHS